MKMKKFARAVCLMLCLAFLLPACGGNAAGNTPTSTSSDNNAPAQTAENATADAPVAVGIKNVLDEKTVKIAILRNLWTDRSGLAIQSYCKYMEENMNVKFQLVTLTGSTAEATIAGVENAIATGCKIVITTIVSGGMDQCARICKSAGAAFAITYVAPTAVEQEILQGYDNYVGAVSSAVDGKAVGREMAETLIAEGKNDFAVVSFTEGLLEATDSRTAGFLEAAAEKGANVVVTLREAPGPSMITAVSTMLQTYKDQIKYIAAYGGGTNFVAPALTANQMTTPIAVPQFPDDYETFFQSGILDYIVAFNDDIFALAVALGINYLNGQQVANVPADRIYSCGNVNFRTAEGAREYDEYTNGTKDRSFSIDEIKSIITAYNPDATFDDVMKLATTNDLEGIKARHNK